MAEWRKETALMYAAPPRPRTALGFAGKVVRDRRSWVGEVPCGKKSLSAWSDAPSGDQSAGGKYCLGYVIGLMSLSLSGPFHILPRTSKFSRKLVKSSADGGVYAPSGMIDLLT